MNFPFPPGTLLHGRYLVQLYFGQGQLSQQYLANDTHHFDEPCVVHEFHPVDAELVAGEERQSLATKFRAFVKTRQALNHPQITPFRESFELTIEESLILCFVEDFVEGHSYQDLLNLRLSQGKCFSASEIMALLTALLPVVVFLHEQQFCLGSLQASDIIQRDRDQLPILVNLEGLQPAASPKALIKDLQRLATMAIALMTGKTETDPDSSAKVLVPLEPQADDAGPLFDSLQQVLEPADQPQLTTATDWLGFLTTAAPTTVTMGSSEETLEETLAESETPLDPPVADNPEATEAAALPSSVAASDPTNTHSADDFFVMTKSATTKGCLQKLLWLWGLMAIAAWGGWWAGRLVVNHQQQTRITAIEKAESNSPKTGLALKNEIRTRRLNTGLTPPQFQRLVDDWLWFQAQQSPPDPPDPEVLPPGDEQKRLDGAVVILDSLETLSPEALLELRQSPSGDQRRWIPRVNQLRLSSRSFYDLVNARFQQEFPNINPEDLPDRPLAIAWNALAFDTLLSLEDESHYQKLNFTEEEPRFNLSGKLKPGGGFAYAIDINQAQFLNLQLQAPAGTHLSLYSPSGNETYLKNSSIKQWSGRLIESGYYELVITSSASEAFNFQLSIDVR